MKLNVKREDRVRAATNPEINRRLDDELEQRLRFYATQDRGAITARIEALDEEWDIERTLQTNAASLSLFGFLMGVMSGRKWLVLPIAVSAFLLQHALQGWCPPVPVLRNMGFRTRMEIERERCALKLLRGDFEHLERAPGPATANTNQLAAMVRS